jgi:hypothetical protein
MLSEPRDSDFCFDEVDYGRMDWGSCFSKRDTKHCDFVFCLFLSLSVFIFLFLFVLTPIPNLLEPPNPKN